MSRAFVKENDNAREELAERPISTAPNFVTTAGLAAIDAEIVQLNAALSDAGEDRAARARVQRDLRYWTARRSNAQLMPAPASTDTVQFGSTVTLIRDDGRGQVFRIVGEDEADPARGTLSHIAPLARALLGKQVGDDVQVAGHKLEIKAIV